MTRPACALSQVGAWFKIGNPSDKCEDKATSGLIGGNKQTLACNAVSRAPWVALGVWILALHRGAQGAPVPLAARRLLRDPVSRVLLCVQVASYCQSTNFVSTLKINCPGTCNYCNNGNKTWKNQADNVKVECDGVSPARAYWFECIPPVVQTVP